MQINSSTCDHRKNINNNKIYIFVLYVLCLMFIRYIIINNYNIDIVVQWIFLVYYSRVVQ